MDIDELGERITAGETWEAEILSVTPMIYIVRLLSGERTVPLQENGSNRVFRNIIEAGKALAASGLQAGYLVHESVDDEMTAGGAFGSSSTRTPIHFYGEED